MTKNTSYADRVRSKLIKDAETALSSSGANELEFSPDVGTHKIRILPPVKLNDKGKLVEDLDSLFYYTHSYHWIPNDANDMRGKNGKYLWTRKNYTDDSGKTHRDPIDEAVQQFYSVGRKQDDEQLLMMGGILKRKRNFFCNIILFADDGPVFKVLVDRTNEGRLMRLICGTMGIPFWRDVEDNWVDKASTEIDEEKDYYDLLDIESGHDFKIVKEKTGTNPWDISYEKSWPVKKARPLEEDELALLDERIDLTTFINYEESYNVVKSTLDSLIGVEADEEDEVEEAPKVKAPKKAAAAKVVDDEVEKVNPDDEEAIDDMLNELD